MFYKRFHNGTSCLCGIVAELMVRKSSFIILIYETGGVISHCLTVNVIVYSIFNSSMCQ